MLAGCCGLAITTAGSCPPDGGGGVRAQYDFAAGEQGWKPLFSDYSPDMTETMELDSGVRSLPPELGPATAYYMQSMNRSDDVFMLLYRRLGASDGVTPGASYVVRYSITMASDAPAGCIGIGGAPGEDVTLKAGAAGHEPSVVVEGSDSPMFRVTIDKGDQSTGGKDMSVAGDITNGGDSSECGTGQFRTFVRTHEHPGPVTATADGDLWLLVGTDSGYEGLTRLYYERIDVELAPAR